MARRASPLLLALLPALGCSDDSVSHPQTPKFGAATPEELVSAMSLEEKVEQMHGTSLAAVNDLFETPENARLEIPGFRMVDGPRGARAGKATAFPVAAARGASFDPELERRVGEAIGAEASAKGANVLLAPTMNVLRHPAWGRAQETYGEDTVHLGVMAVAFIEGAQQHVMASAKHFACNSIEDTRFDVNVTIDERALREVYLPHFRRAVVDGKVASVMSAYNSLNGHPASENAHLLGDILKGEWAFDGFVESDWLFGTRSTVGAANAGLDIEMPAATYFGPSLVDAVNAGDVDVATVDEAVTRILRKKTEYAAFMRPALDPAAVESPEHLALAREVASAGMVLLKNQGALPIARTSGTLVVVGALAEVANLGDLGSSSVTPTSAVTPLQGIEAAAGDMTVVYVPGPTLSATEQMAISAADAVVVVVGLTSDDEGESLFGKGGDRETLSLRPDDEALIAAVAALSDRTVVVLEAGSAIVVRPFVDDVEALLMAWYPGAEGGAALADVLFGDVEPGGRLPITFPRSEADLPTFDHESLEVTYGLLHGYRYLDAQGLAPEFPFGFGLSYTTFALSEASVGSSTLTPDGTLTAQVRVTNTGAREGSELVQLYVRVDGSSVERAPRDLRAFRRVRLAPGASEVVELTVAASDLMVWTDGAWELEPGAYAVELGTSSRDVAFELPLSVGQ
jgi:beta-glucosidase